MLYDFMLYNLATLILFATLGTTILVLALRTRGLGDENEHHH